MPDNYKVIPGKRFRCHWTMAYEEAIFRTTRGYAPWYIVPADHKWYRDAVIAQVLLDALQRMNPQYPRGPVGKSVS